jgi:dTDP-4-amino-4,6-dideoxygalactose transaminase
VDVGSSYLPSEIQAAYLWGQLEWADKITQNRLATWNHYYEELSELAQAGRIELPEIPADCQHNGHMFYLKTKNLKERTALLEHLKADDIYAVFHYVPLHSAPAGLRFSRFHGEDVFTTRESERLVRLPLWYEMDESIQASVISSLQRFYT